jgi:hypothetical protein
MLNAFCRVAPSVRLNFLAILAAGVFLRAIVFSSRTSTEVHARRFLDFFAVCRDFFAMTPLKLKFSSSSDNFCGSATRPVSHPKT